MKSRENLKKMVLTFCEDVEVAETCQDVEQAIEAIAKHRPDIVFLDVQMQAETGFDLLTRLKSIDFEVIFTTAHAEYAIKAIRFSAMDYLLKPIDVQELQDAVAKVKAQVSGSIVERMRQLLHNVKATSSENYKLALPTNDGLTFIKINDILYLKASGNYTEIYMTDGQKYLVSRHLKEYDDLLPENSFFRIHHSTLINVNFIKSYVRGDGGYVIMTDSASLDVARRKKDAFLEKIGYKA
jgi:two-component system LytT family response regulator